MRKHLYNILPILFTSVNLLGIYIGGPWVGLGLVIIFVVHPLLDHLLTKLIGDQKNYIDRVSNMGVYTWPIVHTLYLFSGTYFLLKEPNPVYFLIGCVSIGTIAGGFGITIAHELIHRTKKWERGLGVWALSLVNFAVFRIEHVHGHHRQVATPHDPATAEKGESIYSFIPKAIFGVFRGALRIENNRVSRLNKTPFRFIHHRVLHYVLFSIVLSILIFVSFGIAGITIFFIQSIVAISLLEMVDYIEHYGLLRKKLPNGKYEPVGPEHSWDTNFFMTNTTLYNLGKHAHHHQVASLPFQNLTNTDGANNYPFGYSTAVLLALIPPLWRKTVDPLLDS